MSADPENEFFSDGLTEELLNILAKNPGLKVTGRTSSFAFKGKQEDVRGIGQKLGVDSLLEGSVRKAGNRLRITAQLVNANDGFHLWSQTYDRVLDDVFALQDEIARSVAEALNVKLLGKPEEPRAVDPQSYELLLRANQAVRQGTTSSLAVAVDLYRKAIDRDPVNGRAWAGLARAFTNQIAWGHSKSAMDQDFRRDAKQAAERALEIDDQLPEAHDVMCWILSSFELRFAEALAAIRRAHALAPNQPHVLATLALIEALFGRFPEALRYSKRAIELEPLGPDVHLNRARILLWAGHAREAEEACRRVLELSAVTSANTLLSWSLVFQGRTEEALAVLRREESVGYRTCGEAIAYHAMGKQDESDRALAELIQCGDAWSFQVACVCAWRGEVDKAFEWLEKSVAFRDTGIPITRVHPLLKNLHDDPRWKPLLEKIGLTG